MKSLFLFIIFLALLCEASLCHGASAVRVGAGVLRDDGYGELAGKRVGLVTNRAAVVDGIPVAEQIAASGTVRLAALFAPEHGLHGAKEDGEKVGEEVDERSGVRVYSLYGGVRKPTPEMLHNLDILVYDIQGVGARFYTYISTMGLAMQAAAEAHLPFVVLDRPNPLGGEYLSGPVLEPAYGSFVGEYPIPVTHGMTAGELALMIKGERMLPGLETLDLRVVRMSGWHRGMQWPETGLAWVRTSPNIPDFETALLYPGVCLLEGTSASVGRGTREPFKLVGFPGLDADELARRLNSRNLPGVRFEPASFVPRSIPGMSSDPRFRDRKTPGVRIVVTDPRVCRPVETGLNLLSIAYAMLGKGDRETFFRKEGFDLLSGTAGLRQAVEKGAAPDEIVASWSEGLARFAEKRRRYLLY